MYAIRSYYGMKPINVGLCGTGVVGGGTAVVLKRNAEEIARRAGRPIMITMAASRELDRARELCGEEVTITDNVMDVVSNPDIDIVVELIGGSTIAKEIVLKAIRITSYNVCYTKLLRARPALPRRRRDRA